MANELFSISIDQLNINGAALDFEHLKPSIHAGLAGALTQNKMNYDQARGPDGSAQKPLSPEYAKRKEAGQAGGPGRQQRYGRGVRNLTLAGTLLNSIQIREEPQAVVAYFDGAHYSGLSNAELAAVQLGYGGKLHYLTKRQVDQVLRYVSRAMTKQLGEAVTVTRKP